ncbi:MAG: peptide transporter [Devosia sp.]|uniref:ABC transporter permease subunit n=1 Tax=Devosia sp. TaxID=1871048 RepID=UPI0026367B6A|nr:ABC transporter permease subunit [Devosia sp.]MDB5540911.1 peptide transporter [Devosia sp.]
MRDFVLTRLAAFFGAVIGTAVLLFLALDILPGAGAPDRPAWARFLGLFIGDTGASPNMFGERLAVTLPLVLLALAIAAAGGIALGLSAGWYHGGILGRAAKAVAAGLAVLPPFWLGMLLALLFAGALKLLPASGFVRWGDNPAAALASLILPALALGLPYAGQLALRVRRDLSEASDTEILQLRAEGLTPRQARWRIGLDRALPELPQVLGRTFGALLLGAALVESVFYLPGLGRQIIGAAVQHDLALLRGGLFVLVVLAALGMLLFALLRLLVDPALRPELRR